MTDEQCTLLVTGSTGTVYSVVVAQIHGKTSMTCTCQAGQKMSMCKHRQAVIDGDESVLDGQQTENWTLAQKMIESSVIKASIEQLEYSLQDNIVQQKELLQKIEPEMSHLKAEHTQLKKIFAAMLQRGL